MYDDMIGKIFELQLRVMNETKKNVELRVERECVSLIINDAKMDMEMHCAWIYSPSEDTEKDLWELHDILLSMLKDGAVGA